MYYIISSYSLFLCFHEYNVYVEIIIILLESLFKN